jgi:hypothetical protein
MPEGDAFTPGPYLGPHPSDLQAALDRLDAGGDLQLSADGRDRALQSLAAMHVSTVVAGPSPGQDRVVEFLSSLLGRPPVLVDGVAVWWHIDQVTGSQPAGARPPPTDPNV